MAITFARPGNSLRIRAGHSIVHWERSSSGWLDDRSLTLFAAHDWVPVLASISAVPLRLQKEVDQLLVVSLGVVLIEKHRAVREHSADTIAVVWSSATSWGVQEALQIKITARTNILLHKDPPQSYQFDSME